jgi:hypothetical protein
VVNRILDPLYRVVAGGMNPPPWFTDGARLEASHRWLARLDGWGGHGFMAYEVVCDLTYTHYLTDAPDRLTWANPGPGAERGIRRLLGRKDVRISKADQLEIMRRTYTWVDAHRDPLILPTLEMRDIEHSLCAWDKYQRNWTQLEAGERVTRLPYRPPPGREP